MYKVYKEHLSEKELQNDTIFDIVHYQIIDRNKKDEIFEQIQILSLYDRIAVSFSFVTDKVSRVFVNGIFPYSTNTKAKTNGWTIGESYYNEIFKNKGDINVPFECETYLSRILIADTYSYIESNEELNTEEVDVINEIGRIFTEQVQKLNEQLKTLKATLTNNK